MARSTVRLDKLIASLGYCSRREVGRLIRDERIEVCGSDKLKYDMQVNPADVTVDGEELDPLEGMALLLNKPVGYTCTLSADEGMTVYDLLPERFSRRNPVLACVGRLDKETSGLLLMSDDGNFVHRMTSPKHGVEKIYRVELRDDLKGNEKEVFEKGGMLLEGELKPLKPARFKSVDSRNVELAINEGRHHQIRKMFAAVGNEVVSLNRVSVGSLSLDGVSEGEFRLLSDEEKQRAQA